MAQGQPWQKVSENPSQSISQEWWLKPAIPAMREAEAGGSQSEVSLRQKLERPYLKNN
jgi:hypothetical protein